MAEPRELILKLGQKITDRIGVKVTENDPEYWGLASVVTDEMAEVALAMKVRVPATAAEVAKKCKKSVERTEELLEEMSVIGVIEYNWENEDHHKQYVLPMFVPGCAEFMVMNKEQVEEHTEIADFFEQMARLPLEKVTPMVPLGGAGIGMHVIPVEKAIPANQQSASVEHISHWLNKYDKYSVGACSCRRQQRIRGEGTGDLEDDLCIGVGDMADYCVETGKGRYIDYDEVMEILQRAEDNGYVHQITNIDGEDKIFAICNCNVNVCYALRTSQLFNTPNMSRSAYVAKVDKANCVACGKCVEFCPAGAVKLGQKLCDKEGCEVQYPRTPLPSEQPWGEHMWSHNYRDVNRINCYDTGTAPCKTACPAHVAVQGYLKLAKEGRYDDALALIKKDNPFPAVCGSICNRRCEDACTRGTVDEAVAIDEVKRFLAERDLNAETRYIPKKTIPSLKGGFDEKIAIIGAGPAGLSCAYYLALTGYKPTIFEKNEEPGGMLRYGIPSYKLEKDLLAAEIDVIRELGVEIRCGVEIGKDITIEELREQGYKGFYVAIGCQRGRKPGITGENAKGTYAAVDFLREAGAKESFALEGDVVVVGGGNVAIDAARISSRCVDAKISMFCLEQRENMPASKEEIAEALEEGIELNCGWGPKEVLEEDGKVAGVVFKKCIRVLDEQGRFSPEYDEEQTVTIPCKHVIFSVGQAIEWGNMLDNLDLKRRPNGGALADKLTYQTSEPDIFVGGDVYTGPKFAIDAIAAGKQGAISIHRFVQPQSSLTIGRNRNDFIELDKNDIKVENYDNSSRQIPGHNDAIDTKHSFRDAKLLFTEEQVKAETARCLGCGASVVDPNKCIGCGVCTTKCVFDAIHLHREIPGASVMRASEDKLKYILPNMVKQSIKVKFAKKK